VRLSSFVSLATLALVLLAMPLARAAGYAAPAADGCPPEPQPYTAEDNAAGMRDATDAGLLWKATRDGRVAWLYGTIHVAQRNWRFPGPHVLAALKASDTVVLELDPLDPQVLARFQRVIVRKPGSPELPPALAARLRAQAIAACIAPAALDGLRPEMRAVTIELMAGRRLGLQPDYGIDLFLAQLARQMNKPVRALETPELQAALLVSDDPRETARTVGDLLDELESGRAPHILGRLAGDWHEGRFEDMASYADWCKCMETPAQRADFAKLIDARNPPMAARIAEWHAEGRALFVAVGSLHMTGALGLPALLREKGFEVQRVDFAAASK
jgi:uncharacterized protein YbaP (TraB family)